MEVSDFTGSPLQVTVTDSGVPPLSDTTVVAVTVRDINDNPPIFADSFLNLRYQRILQMSQWWESSLYLTETRALPQR